MSKKIIFAAAVSSLALIASYAYADEGDNTVVVFGQRAAERNSIEQQKKAKNLINVITANDAGKLPDQNVAETVQRVPGVTMDDDQGEGRYVVIRGLDPSLSAVRINGQDAAAPETDTRTVKLDTIPTGLIGSVEIIKSQSAEYDANAMAGAVNIKTISAFDKKKPFLGARLSGTYIEQNKKNAYDADISGGKRFGANGEFGVAFALNASRRPQSSENVQGSSAWEDGLPDDWRIRSYYVIRNRQGAALNLDYRPNDNLQLYAKTLYSHYTDLEQRQQFRVKLGDATLSNITDTGATYSSTRGVRDMKYRDEDENIATINLGGKYFMGKNKLEIDFTNSSAKKDDDPRYNFSYQTGKKDVSGTINVSENLFDITTNANAYNLAKYTSKELELEEDHYQEDLNQFKIDYTIPTELFGGNTEFKTGIKYSDRHKQSDVYYRLYTVSGMTLSNFTTEVIPDLYGGKYVLGSGVDFMKSYNYAVANNLMTLDSASSVADDLGGDYDVKEKVTAAYAQATIINGALTIVPGLRFEHTSSEFAAKSFDETSSFDTPFNSFGSKDYNDFFPSVVGKYALSDNQLLRFAITTSIGRPNYVDISPYVIINRGDDEVEMGNPNLKPLKSVNLDLGYEHYFGKGGVASIQTFYKDIEDPIFQTLTNSDSGSFAGYDVTTFANLAKAKVYGVELNYINQFDSLPAPFDGFGVNLNLTMQKSSTDGAPNRSDKVSLIYTSDTTGTAEITYEKKNLTARLAYSYRSEFLDTLGESKDSDIYTAGRGRVDFKLGYAVTDNFQVFVQGKNLNDANWRRYYGYKNQLVENEKYGKTWAFGVEAKF
jgi:TonB-dependent receptor